MSLRGIAKYELSDVIKHKTCQSLIDDGKASSAIFQDKM